MKQDSIGALVDVERGEICASVFIDDAVFERELERLFPRCWLFLAHDTMLPSAGDYMTTFMGTDPVIVARQRDGSVKAFLNFCRHRGMPVCRGDSGNTRAFHCSYHGWSYDVAGNLIGVPRHADGYHRELDKSKWGLAPVPRIESYKGLFFGCFDPDAPSLRDYLGEATWYLDGVVDRTPGGIEVLGPPLKWVLRGNWKLAAEQFAGDAYHFETTHSSAMAGFPKLDDVVKANVAENIGLQWSSRLGHGALIALSGPAGRMPVTNDPAVAAYIQEEASRAAENLGSERANMMFISTIFPNLSFQSQSFIFRVWHPRGPNAFEVWSWPFAERTARPEVKLALKRASQLMFSPTGIAEQDDGENWSEIGRVLEAGRLNRRVKLNYQMGLGHARADDPIFPGTISRPMFGDNPQRGFYRRWKDFVSSEAWPHLSEEEVGELEPSAGRAGAPSGREGEVSQ